MGTLQGKWIFNEDLDLPQGVIEEEVPYDNLVFGSLLLKCWKIKITNSYIDYYSSGSESVPPGFNFLPLWYPFYLGFLFCFCHFLAGLF